MNPENLSLKERERLAFMAGNHELAEELGRQIDEGVEDGDAYDIGYADGHSKGYGDMRVRFILAMQKAGISEVRIAKVLDQL